jgi:hypothetical protein
MLQIPMRRWSRCPRTRCWRRTGSCARCATRGSSASRTCSSTGAGTTSPGGSSRRTPRRRGARCTCARSRRACTTTRHAPWATSRGSRSTSAASTARRSGSATSATSATPCSPTGRRTPRLAARASTDATAAPSSQGRVFLRLFLLQFFSFPASDFLAVMHISSSYRVTPGRPVTCFLLPLYFRFFFELLFPLFRP